MYSSSLSPDSGGVSFLQVFLWRNKNIGTKFFFWANYFTQFKCCNGVFPIPEPRGFDLM